MIFIDSNVLIDASGEVSASTDWSLDQLARGNATDQLVVNPVIVAELAPRFPTMAAERAFFESMNIAIIGIDDAAAFRAGQAHAAYRRAGGTREAVLADFLIGGHASALGARLLTRDKKRFAAYFPDLTLITPETDHG